MTKNEYKDFYNCTKCDTKYGHQKRCKNNPHEENYKINKNYKCEDPDCPFCNDNFGD